MSRQKSVIKISLQSLKKMIDYQQTNIMKVYIFEEKQRCKN